MNARELHEIAVFLRWVRAKLQLLDTVNALVTGESDIPQFTLPVRSMTRRVHRRYPEGPRPPAVPFGWTARKQWNRYAWELGPWWYLRGRELVNDARHWFYSLMLYKLKWATLDEECGYYHDVKWRFIEETRWPK